MELSKERQLPDLTNGSNEKKVILSEDALRQMSKNVTGFIPNNVESPDESAFARVQSMLPDLLQTASSTELSLTHGAAALSALCALLEQCSISSESRIRYLVYKAETWKRAFNIYLTKSDTNKPKPLRRLLMTLARLVSTHPVDTEKGLLLGNAICTATRAIRKQNESDIKPAIQALEHFLSRDLISAAEIAQIKIPEELGLSRMKSMRTKNQKPDNQQEQVNQSVQKFALDVLGWMQYPDCSPAVGRFLRVFFESHEENQSEDAIQTSKEGVIPLWISPVKQCLERHQGLLEVFEIHILPDLLRLGSADVKAFLKTLQLESIQRGEIGSSSILDIQLCLLVAKIAEEPSLRKYFGSEQSTSIDSESLGISLLEHSSSSVRIAALSLLVSSSASTRPLCRRVLCRLRQCIPYFHVEVSAKPRNEFIALMKKLCMRIRGATISLLKRGQDSDILIREETYDTTLWVAKCDVEGLASSGNVVEQAADDESHILKEHLAFRKWYMVFLLQELRPTASYQSHITALKILKFLIEQTIAVPNTSSKSRDNYFSALNEYLPRGLFLRPLTELLLDPFDDVRESAHTVFDLHLSMISMPQTSLLRGGTEIEADSVDKEAKNQVENEEEYRKANHSILSDLNRAENKVRVTGRADHADGFGRLSNLLYTTSAAIAEPARWHQSCHSILDHVIATLEKEARLAKDDLLLAISKSTLQGHLIALRYIVSRSDYTKTMDASLNIWEGFNRRIFSICSTVWEVVQDVLCFDAPEGREFREDDFNERDVGTKDVLSFCWRALKESSLLTHAMVTNIGYIPSPLRESPDYEGYYMFGYLAFTQLAKLRHRGAFSTVSHTFAAYCVMCARSSQVVFREYPKTWYKLALKIIEDNASSLTRRSAGIPAIITGVLAAYPGDRFFDDVVVNLQTMANAPIVAGSGSLPQVHALNCLKDIFTDARFGLSTETYVANTLEIAASCLESQIWNIRNCGLMLFKALLKRLNGGTDTSSTKASSSHRRFSQLTYEKYPNLPDLLLRLLRRSPNQTQVTGREFYPTMQAHRVFPAFEVIERSGIPSQYQDQFLDALQYYNESADWSIREKAAKALSLIVDEGSIVEEVTSLLAPNWHSQNRLHGRLLRLRFLLARNEAPLFGELLSTYEAIPAILENSFETLIAHNSCPITAAAFLDILVDLFATLILSNSKITESFLLPKLTMVQEDSAKCSALALQESSLRRCINLASYEHALKSRPQRYGSSDTLSHFTKADTDALGIVNTALQVGSDENDLAVLRLCSARELRWASDVTQCCSDANVETTSKNNRHSDFSLALQGYALGERYAIDATNTEVRVWICLLCEAGAEHSDLRTRTAAVFSIRAFFDGLLDHDLQLTPDSRIFGVYLALYDSLLDDDEDVRDQGARVASRILSEPPSGISNNSIPNLSLSPPAARDRLLRSLCEGFRDSIALCVESARRLTGMGSAPDSASAKMHCKPQTKQGQSTLRLRTIPELSLEARTTSTVVFVEERQNLYIDTVSEAESWAELLSRLEPEAWPSSLVSELEAWTVEGLAYILEILETGLDGALSPTSKPEVFALFTRVLLTAKVLVMRFGVHVSSKGMGREHVCVGLLEKLLELGRSRLFHDLLLYRIETILEEIS